MINSTSTENRTKTRYLLFVRMRLFLNDFTVSGGGCGGFWDDSSKALVIKKRDDEGC